LRVILIVDRFQSADPNANFRVRLAKRCTDAGGDSTHNANTMPIKVVAAAPEGRAQPERTVANELPQELSKLPEHDGFSDMPSSLKGGKPAAQGGRRGNAGRRKKAAAVPKSRKRTAPTTTGFTDDGHPTILADTHG